MTFEYYLNQLKEVEDVIVEHIEEEFANALNNLVLKVVIELLQNNDSIVKGLLFYGRSPSVSESINSFLGVDYLIEADSASNVPASPLYQNVTARYSINNELYFRVPLLDYDTPIYTSYILPLIDGKSVRANIVNQWLETPNTNGEEGQRVFLIDQLEDIKLYLQDQQEIVKDKIDLEVKESKESKEEVKLNNSNQDRTQIGDEIKSAADSSSISKESKPLDSETKENPNKAKSRTKKKDKKSEDLMEEDK